MLSEKLDRVMAAEKDAAVKISEAEKRSAEMIAEAKLEAENIREKKKAEAASAAEALISKTADECREITETYKKDADAEADKLKKVSAVNEMFGMSMVISKIIP